MKVDFFVSIAMLLWFMLSLGLWRFLTKKLDTQIQISIEDLDESFEVKVIPYARENQSRPRNRRHGRARGRMPASA